MTDWLKHQHKKRCERKRAYRKATLAEQDARRASQKSGDLIIAYQCYDCGWWHIGHADASQIAARQRVGKPLCVICNQPIAEARRKQARRSGNITMTCSWPCAKQFKRQRRAARTAGDGGPKGSSQQPC